AGRQSRPSRFGRGVPVHPLEEALLLSVTLALQAALLDEVRHPRHQLAQHPEALGEQLLDLGLGVIARRKGRALLREQWKLHHPSIYGMGRRTSMAAIQKVGFLGLGIMGSRIAKSLAKKGF